MALLNNNNLSHTPPFTVTANRKPQENDKCRFLEVKQQINLSPKIDICYFLENGEAKDMQDVRLTI